MTPSDMLVYPVVMSTVKALMHADGLLPQNMVVQGFVSVLPQEMVIQGFVSLSHNPRAKHSQH